MSDQAAANKALIERFYEAFDRHDGEAMAACYGPNARFHDPAFGELHGDEPGAMWKMLTGRADDLRVRPCRSTTPSDTTGTRALAGRPTRSPRPAARSINDVQARFRFADGLIAEHDDSFGFHAWSQVRRWARPACCSAGPRS